MRDARLILLLLGLEEPRQRLFEVQPKYPIVCYQFEGCRGLIKLSLRKDRRANPNCPSPFREPHTLLAVGIFFPLAEFESLRVPSFLGLELWAMLLDMRLGILLELLAFPNT